jgi:hypothetical protein
MPRKPTRAPVAAVPEETDQDRRLERRLERVEAQLEHLEAALEGLQDALYRQAQRDDDNREELLRRTEPERIARELSDDARRRGL